MKLYPYATNTTDETIFFDYQRGEVYTGQARTVVDPPEGPLSRLQGRLQRGDNWPINWLGNQVSTFRFWMDRLIR